MNRNAPYTIRCFKQDEYHRGIYPITDRSPIRLRRIVEAIARYIQREEHYDAPPFDAVFTAKHHPGYVAYLIGDGSGYWIGACVFEPVKKRSPGVPPADWLLDWVWIHPFCRGRRILSEAWQQLEREHGQFLVLAPLSHGMERFLERQGVSEDRVVCMGGSWEGD